VEPQEDPEITEANRDRVQNCPNSAPPEFEPLQVMCMCLFTAALDPTSAVTDFTIRSFKVPAPDHISGIASHVLRSFFAVAG
jgi:hypothetical protein